MTEDDKKRLTAALEGAKKAGILDIDTASNDEISPELINYCTDWANKNKERVTAAIAKKRQK